MSINPRDTRLDLLKSLLVIGMVTAHVIQFLSRRNEAFLLGFSEYINIISFSGFLFAFGYGSFLAYFQKPLQAVWKRMLMTALKTLIAFYISGLAFRVLVDRRRLFAEDFWNIILLRDIPGYSEFLLSFSLIILLALVFFKAIQRLLEHPLLFWVTLAMLLLSTFLPYELIQSPQLGLLIGTYTFASFPVVQYSPFYLLGIFFARQRLGFHWLSAVIAFALTGTFIFASWQQGAFPSRFPPSWLWIIAPSGFLYLYYLLATWFSKKFKVPEILLRPGKNVLLYLLMSNLMIFALSTVFRNSFGMTTTLFTALGILASCHYLIGITRAR